MHRIRTRGHMMLGAYRSTKLLWPPRQTLFVYIILACFWNIDLANERQVTTKTAQWLCIGKEMPKHR